MITSTQREAIIESARSCIGCPFKHQGRVPEYGVDCVGLVRYAGVAAGLISEEFDFTAYPAMPNPSEMKRLLSQYMQPLGLHTLRPADVIWFRIRRDPQHLGIFTYDKTIIHSVYGQGVVETGFRSYWQSRIMGIFAYKVL